jgi:hypothetical protein
MGGRCSGDGDVGVIPTLVDGRTTSLDTKTVGVAQMRAGSPT